MQSSTATAFNLNHKRFIHGQTALTQDPDAFGFFRKARGGVLLYTRSGRRIGGIRRDGLLYRSSRLEIRGEWRWWHQPAAPEELGGLDYAGRMAREEVEAALQVADVRD